MKPWIITEPHSFLGRGLISSRGRQGQLSRAWMPSTETPPQEGAVIVCLKSEDLSEASALGAELKCLTVLAGTGVQANPPSNCAVLRLPRIYGPGQTGADPVPQLLKQLKASSKKKVQFGDVPLDEDFLYIDDAISAIELVIARAQPGTYELSDLKKMKWHPLVESAEGLRRTWVSLGL